MYYIFKALNATLAEPNALLQHVIFLCLYVLTKWYKQIVTVMFLRLAG